MSKSRCFRDVVLLGSLFLLAATTEVWAQDKDVLSTRDLLRAMRKKNDRGSKPSSPERRHESEKPTARDPNQTQVLTIDANDNELRDSQAPASGQSVELKKLIHRVKYASGVERAEAIRTLGLMGEEAAPAIDVLIAAMTDNTWIMIQWSGGSAPTHPIHPGVGSGVLADGSIVSAPRSPNSIGELARVALINIGESAIRPLIAVLRANTPNHAKRACAAEVLGKTKSSEAVLPLIATLNDNKREFGRRPLGISARSLGFYQQRKPERWHIRRNTAIALGTIGDTRALRPLLNVGLKDTDPGVRAAAIGALRLLEANTDEKNIAKIVIDPITDALSAATKEKAYIVQEEAAKALETLASKLNDGRAVEPLLAVLLQDSPPDNSQVNERTSSKIETKLKSQEQKLWRSANRAAISALACIKDPRVVPVLVKVMRTEEYPFRESAIYALGRIGDSQSVEALLNALKDKTYPESVRKAVVTSLDDEKEPRIIETLIAAYEAGWKNPVYPKAPYMLAGNKFKTPEKCRQWWSMAKKRLERGEEWWWAPGEEELAEYARQEETIKNGQIYQGMPVSAALELWGQPVIYLDEGGGKFLLFYKHRLRDERSLQLNFESGKLSSISDNKGNVVKLKSDLQANKERS